ncbi:MAG: hypothetical protein PHQ40_06070, partial [Anaerolineaceae bacterium]|nr:hypothetical protein [Anaerolineaceae bacterium]
TGLQSLELDEGSTKKARFLLLTRTTDPQGARLCAVKNGDGVDILIAKPSHPVETPRWGVSPPWGIPAIL